MEESNQNLFNQLMEAETEEEVNRILESIESTRTQTWVQKFYLGGVI